MRDTVGQAFVSVDSWYTPRDAFADSFVETDVNLDIEDLESDDERKVVFTIPELDVRASAGYFDPVSLRHASVRRTLWLPDDAEPGEYVIRMTVYDEDGRRHVRHRFVEIE